MFDIGYIEQKSLLLQNSTHNLADESSSEIICKSRWQCKILPIADTDENK